MAVNINATTVQIKTLVVHKHPDQSGVESLHTGALSILIPDAFGRLVADTVEVDLAGLQAIATAQGVDLAAWYEMSRALAHGIVAHRLNPEPTE